MRKAKKRAVPKKKAVVRKVRKGAKAWTAADIAMLRKMYRTTPTRSLARQMKRSAASLQAKARALGLKKAVVKKAAKKVAKRKAAPKRKAGARRKAAPKRIAAARRKAAPKRKAAKKTARRRK